ncbi:MAG: putative glycolipid-binding domain-containing protein [Vulcanimicrobiaceae bacterium]
MCLGQLVWDKRAVFGVETAAVRIEGDALFASAIGVALEPIPHWFRYELSTVERYVTSAITVDTQGPGWNRRLELHRTSGGLWSYSVEESGEVDLEAPVCDTGIFVVRVGLRRRILAGHQHDAYPSRRSPRARLVRFRHGVY